MENNEVKITNKEYHRLYSFIPRYSQLVSYILRFVIDSIDEATPNLSQQEKFELIVIELEKMNLPFRWSRSNYKCSLDIRADIEKMCDLSESLK